MNTQKSVITALYSHNLAWNAYRETPLDRVIAFAHGPKLGRLLWRWKYGLEDNLAASVLSQTLRKARRRLAIGKQGKDHPTLVLACQQALKEWYYDNCLVCKGAAELVIANRRVICKYCQGTAVQRWSRRKRAEALQVGDALPIWEKRLGELHIIIGGAEAAVNGEAAYMLRQTLDKPLS